MIKIPTLYKQDPGNLKLVKSCTVCGGKLISIRGRYPKTPKREVCPTCTFERLEQINEISSPNYNKAAINPLAT